MSLENDKKLLQDFLTAYNEETFLCACCKKIIFPDVELVGDKETRVYGHKTEVKDEYGKLFGYCCKTCGDWIKEELENQETIAYVGGEE